MVVLLNNKKRLLFIMIPIAAILQIALIVLILIGCSNTLLKGRILKESRNLEDYHYYYNTVDYAKDLLPTLEEVSLEKENINFGYRHITFGVFDSEGISLFLSYGELYSDAKNEIMSKYDFLDSPYQCSDGDYTYPLSDFEYNGYSFKVAPNYNFREWYLPKTFLLLGFDDTNERVCYLYFWDFDLDAICGDIDLTERTRVMHDFIDKYFIWYNY